MSDLLTSDYAFTVTGIGPTEAEALKEAEGKLPAGHPVSDVGETGYYSRLTMRGPLAVEGTVGIKYEILYDVHGKTAPAETKKRPGSAGPQHAFSAATLESLL